MIKHGELDKIIQSDRSGRLYIDSVDFFRQPKVKNMIHAMIEI